MFLNTWLILAWLVMSFLSDYSFLKFCNSSSNLDEVVFLNNGLVIPCAATNFGSCGSRKMTNGKSLVNFSSFISPEFDPCRFFKFWTNFSLFKLYVSLDTTRLLSLGDLLFFINLLDYFLEMGYLLSVWVRRWCEVSFWVPRCVRCLAGGSMGCWRSSVPTETDF